MAKSKKGEKKAKKADTESVERGPKNVEESTKAVRDKPKLPQGESKSLKSLQKPPKDEEKSFKIEEKSGRKSVDGASKAEEKARKKSASKEEGGKSLVKTKQNGGGDKYKWEKESSLRTRQDYVNAKKDGTSKDGLDPLVDTQQSPEEGKSAAECDVDVPQARTATLLLESPETDVVIESLNRLQKFCKKGDAHKKLFIEMGGLGAVRKLIFSDNVLIQRFSMKLVAINSNLHEASLQFRDMDVALDLITLASVEDPVVVEYATVGLESLASLYTGRLQIVQNAGVPVLVHLTTHTDPDIQKNSAETIWRILDEPMNLDLISSRESLLSILKLVESEYPMIQVIGITILEKVASRESGVKVLEEIEAVKSLGEKLQIPEYGDLHRVILRTLANMSKVKSARDKIIPLVPVAAKVLNSSPDQVAKVQSLRLLGILSSVPAVADALIEYSMSKKLIKILSNNDPMELKEAAAYCVSQLAQAGRHSFVDAIEPLLALIQLKELTDSGFEDAMMALAILLEDTLYCSPTFVEKGGLDVFKNLLRSLEKSEDGMMSLLHCISLVGVHWNLRNACVDADIIISMLNAMKINKNPQFWTSCANALYGLLCVEHGRRQFLNNEGYAVIMEFISHIEFPVVVAAVPIIHILGTYPDIAKAFIEQGILQTIWKRQDLISKNGPLRAGFERLISTYLPAKYAITGHIDPYEKLEDGFYDIGGLKSTDCFQTVNQMTWENRDPQRQVLFLNWTGQIPDEVTLGNNSSLQVMKQEGQNCQSLVDVVKNDLSKIRSEKELVVVIASAVSSRFGGPLDKWRISSHSEDVEVADIQLKHKSVVVPISMITNGAFRSRTLLFKALCDVFGIPCSVERGEYKRMWNVVLLQSKKPLKPACPCSENEETARSLVYTEKLRRFVVDLIYNPGTLLPVNSYDANTYCFA